MPDTFSAEAWYAAISSHDPELVRPWLLPESRYEDVPTGTVSNGPDAVLTFLQRTWSAFPDMRMTPTSTLLTERGAAAEWVVTGTHLGDFPGLPATGNRFSIRGASVIVTEGGKVRSVSDYWDLATSGLLGAPAAPQDGEEQARVVGE